MKTAEERLKLLAVIFENYIIAVEQARIEAIAQYHIDVLGNAPPSIYSKHAITPK